MADPNELSDFAKLFLGGMAYLIVQIGKGFWQGWKFKENEHNITCATSSAGQVTRLAKKVDDNHAAVMLEITAIQNRLPPAPIDDRGPGGKLEKTKP